jgi:DNA-binding winged helix-turn-helix (wHTH) protein/tetratricopeptide (TPR) repeat protein
MSSLAPRFYDFGPFRIDASQRLLTRDGTEISLTPKAFDTLLLLVRSNGQIVEKVELLQSVWPNAFVEEATLAQNVFTIRKALGGNEAEQYIQTIPKRGYRFVASVVEISDESADVHLAGPGESSLTAVSEAEVATPLSSIAVLPIINQADDPDAEYLSDGLTESLTNTLSLVHGLQVKACSTVLRYKGTDIDPQQAGRELGVVAVLIGRLLQIKEQLVLRMELVDASKGWQIWGEEYSRRLSDLHILQDEITKDVSENLQLKLAGEEWERISKRHADNAEAHKHYLTGRALLNKCTKKGYIEATDHFEQAIEIDPGFALAYSGLADSYILYDFYGLTPPWNTIPIARAAAVKAVALADDLAEAHTSLASIILIHDRDLIGAEREFKRALRLNPKYARAHNGYSQCLLTMGLTEEAVAECNLALELDPFNLEINQHLGAHYLFVREYDRAIEQLQKTLELGPTFYRARLLLGIAYGQKGAFSEAIMELLQARQLEDTPVLLGFLGYAYGRAGDKKALEVLKELHQVAKESYVPPYSMVLVYVGLGRREEALEWIERACVEHGHWRGWLELTPELDSLSTDPRFIRLLQRRFKYS